MVIWLGLEEVDMGMAVLMEAMVDMEDMGMMFTILNKTSSRVVMLNRSNPDMPELNNRLSISPQVSEVSVTLWHPQPGTLPKKTQHNLIYVS